MTNAPSHSTSQTPRFMRDGGVARITLARPAHRNRLHKEDLAVLMDLFRQIEGDATIRVLVLAAEVLAERPVFSAGFNTGQFEDPRSGVGFEAVTQALEQLRPVTICALGGSVYGGATDLVLACDLAIGVEGMEMRMPVASLGAHFYPGGLVRYVSRLGVSAAKRAFLTAEALDAQTLLRIGYLQELVPAAQLEQRVAALAARVAALAPLALQSIKQSLNELARGEYDLQRLQERTKTTMESEDFAEGRRAFAERRPPVWKGR